MAMAKIKKGDTVVVLAGKDKGKTGEVTRVDPKADKVVVSGVNVRVRHSKPTQAEPAGRQKPFEAPAAHFECRRGRSQNGQADTRSH
jgi:large subunit ribosomal protein L24